MLLDYLIFCLLFAFVMAATYLIRAKVRGSKFLDWIRVIIFFLPFLTPAVFYGLPKFQLNFTSGTIPYLVAIGCSIIAVSIQYKDFKPMLNKDIYPLLPPITTMAFIGMESSIIGSAIFEEIFYRAYVPQSTFWIECIVSGGLFCLSHFIQPMTRKSFTIRSYVILFLLSAAWYYSYKTSGTILPAILGHLIYNSSSIYIIFKRYIFFKQQKGGLSINA